MKFSEKDIGKRVVLPKNEEGGWEEQIGELLSVAEDTIIVQLDHKYFDGDSDDGVRECSLEGVFLEEERKRLEMYHDQMTSLHSEWP